MRSTTKCHDNHQPRARDTTSLKPPTFSFLPPFPRRGAGAPLPFPDLCAAATYTWIPRPPPIQERQNTAHTSHAKGVREQELQSGDLVPRTVHTRRRSRRLYAASAERRRAWNRAATPPGHVFFIVVQALRSIPLSTRFAEVIYFELGTSGIYSSGEPQHKRSTPCRLVQLNPYTDVFEQAAHIPRPKRNANHNNRKEKKEKTTRMYRVCIGPIKRN